MKLSAIAAVVATAGIAQVVAAPLGVSSSAQEAPNHPLDTIRFGHAVHQPPVLKTRTGRMRLPCKGRISPLRQKGIEISNTFRKALGWPLIDTKPDVHGHVQTLVFPGPVKPVDSKHEFWIAKEGGYENGPRPVHIHHHKHHRNHLGGHDEPFINRLHYSLVNLGLWEGRAVAFVIGCGLGVLLRMFWVLTIVMYRVIRGGRRDEQEYSHITMIFEEYEPAPPTYTYPADEKVAIESETKVADTAATVEESN